MRDEYCLRVVIEWKRDKGDGHEDRDLGVTGSPGNHFLLTP